MNITWSKSDDPRLEKRGGWSWFECFDGERQFFVIRPNAIDVSADTPEAIQRFVEESYRTLIEQSA